MSILDLALVAHDTKKDALITWAERHRSLLSGHRILATGTTGQRLKEAIPELKVERVLSGPLGGDLQIGARIAEKRVFPAININRSGTRREELMVDPGDLNKMWILRKIIHPMGEIDSIEFLIDKLAATKTNDEFFLSMKRK